MKKEMKNSSSCGAVYGLGMIGSMIFFLSHAVGFWAGVLAVLKSFIWPVFFVLDGFKHFAA